MAITFKDRVSQFPNRRKLTVVSSTNGGVQIADELIVDVERDEGTITEQGTLFSASNMNTLMAADAVIRNQNEFDALVGQFHATIGSSDPAVIAACPKTIVLVGGGGNGANGEYLVDTDGINLPWTKTGYFHLQGINKAQLLWDCTGIEGNRSAINGGESWEDTNCTFKIENISLIITGTTTNLGVSGFNGCANLENCFAVGISLTVIGMPDYYPAGFKKCHNLCNCYAIIGNESGVSKGFANCVNLINCESIGTAGSAGIGFGDCFNLTNCTGTGVGSTGYGFETCINLTNCTGIGSGSSGFGFGSCTNLASCTGKGTASGSNGYGFAHTTRASNCKDDSSSTGMWYGINKGIDPVTCKKTPATADNSALNS